MQMIIPLLLKQWHHWQEMVFQSNINGTEYKAPIKMRPTKIINRGISNGREWVQGTYKVPLYEDNGLNFSRKVA
jgi:hypothetical protein